MQIFKATISGALSIFFGAFGITTAYGLVIGEIAKEGIAYGVIAVCILVAISSFIQFRDAITVLKGGSHG